MKIIVAVLTVLMIAYANLAFTQVQTIYNQSQVQPSYPQQQTYGAPQIQYGTQQPQPAYGAPQVQQYGTPSVQPYPPSQVSSPMYDNSYNGLFNMYGQPTFMPGGGVQQQQQTQGQDGLIFRGASAIQSAGSYLWSYMPAPLRGVDSSYFGASGTGPTIINFTPGER